MAFDIRAGILYDLIIIMIQNFFPSKRKKITTDWLAGHKLNNGSFNLVRVR